MIPSAATSTSQEITNNKIIITNNKVFLAKGFAKEKSRSKALVNFCSAMLRRQRFAPLRLHGFAVTQSRIDFVGGLCYSELIIK